MQANVVEMPSAEGEVREAVAVGPGPPRAGSPRLVAIKLRASWQAQRAGHGTARIAGGFSRPRHGLLRDLPAPFRRGARKCCRNIKRRGGGARGRRRWARPAAGWKLAASCHKIARELASSARGAWNGEDSGRVPPPAGWASTRFACTPSGVRLLTRGPASPIIGPAAGRGHAAEHGFA